MVSNVFLGNFKQSLRMSLWLKYTIVTYEFSLFRTEYVQLSIWVVLANKLLFFWRLMIFFWIIILISCKVVRKWDGVIWLTLIITLIMVSYLHICHIFSCFKSIFFIFEFFFEGSFPFFIWKYVLRSSLILVSATSKVNWFITPGSSRLSSVIILNEWAGK